jgi:hypothetical protein
MNTIVEPKQEIFFNHIYRSKNGERISFIQEDGRVIVTYNRCKYTVSLEMSKHLQTEVLPKGFYIGEIMPYLTPLKESNQETEEN